MITAELIANGLVLESQDLVTTPGSGRPGIGLQLNSEGAFFIGASIEVEHLTVVKLNLAAQIIDHIQEPIEGSRTPEPVLDRLVQLINQVRQFHPGHELRLRGVGLTLQGSLNLDGIVLHAPFLDWHN